MIWFGFVRFGLTGTVCAASDIGTLAHWHIGHKAGIRHCSSGSSTERALFFTSSWVLFNSLLVSSVWFSLPQITLLTCTIFRFSTPNSIVLCWGAFFFFFFPLFPHFMRKSRYPLPHLISIYPPCLSSGPVSWFLFLFPLRLRLIACNSYSFLPPVLTRLWYADLSARGNGKGSRRRRALYVRMFPCVCMYVCM